MLLERETAIITGAASSRGMAKATAAVSRSNRIMELSPADYDDVIPRSGRTEP